MPDVARRQQRSSSTTSDATEFTALGVVIRPEDMDRLNQTLASITEAERRAERETSSLRVY